MLILTRRAGETLMIGDDITVTVLAVKGNQIRLGVNAPQDMPVQVGTSSGAKLVVQSPTRPHRYLHLQRAG